MNYSDPLRHWQTENDPQQYGTEERSLRTRKDVIAFLTFWQDAEGCWRGEQ